MVEWPEIPSENQKAWETYREGGGLLGYYEWLDAGTPTITEERASLAWMSRTDIWLSSLVDLGEDKGGISEAEYDVVWGDLYDRLFGQGKYVGARQTVIELPSAIRSDVERYWTSLPVTAQREAQEIAQQQAQFPLYARGTQSDQINAGMLAIENLRTQLSAAPSYLQATMRSQITALESSINQLRGSAKLEARQQTEAQGQTREQIRIREEARQEPGTTAQRFAEKYGMSPESAKSTGYYYYLNPEAPAYSNLTLEQKQDLAQVGVEAAGAPPKPTPPPPYNAPESFGQLGETGSPVWKSWFARYYPSIASQFQEKPEEERTETSWMTSLSKERARIREEFARQSPYSRGERPGAYQPRIKTVQF